LISYSHDEKLHYPTFSINSPRFPTQAQTVFVNSNAMLQQKDEHSAVPVGIADMNGDGLDDIVTLNSGHILNIQYQTPDPNRPFVVYAVARVLT
jgi:hypothetical protein